MGKPRTTSAAPSGQDVSAGGGEMGALVRAHGWAATPLGAIETWSPSVKTAVSLCLTSRFPIVLWLGPELRLVYNEAYIPFLGEGKHPHVLGRPGREAWAEIWASIGPMHDEVRAGKATWVEDLRMFFARRLPLEEVYVTFAFSPILAGDGSTVEGTFCACTETSDKIIGERRLSTLRDLSVRATEQRTVEAACQAAAEALQANAHDIPFAAVYLLDDEGAEAHRAAAVRLPAAAGMFPATCPLSGTPPTAGPWPLARVAATQATEEIHDLAATVGVITAGPFPEPIETAFVLPLAAPSQPRLAGFLIVGLSPRRVLDAGYRSFLNLVAGHIATAIAEARAFEAERRRAEALAEIDRAKTAFFSNVSHEFRTPLTLMLGPLEEVLAGGRSSDLALIDTAHRNGLRLLKLVNTLLDFSRIEAGRAQASYEPVDLAALTADLASSFRSAIERAGLDFVVTTPLLPRPVHVDRDMWEKVVLNLLSNAFKFTFEGGIAVTLAPSPDGSAAVLEVRDTGTGIPAEELPRLFERFHRVAGARGRTFEGSGIGLALVQELVNLHGGTIAVESEEGRGSAFIVSLPFGTAHLPPDRINAERPVVSSAVRAQAYVEEALRWLPGNAAGPGEDENLLPGDDLGLAALAAPAAGGGRVLLADDNADMRDYVRRLLAGQGYGVEAVGDGEAALAAAQRQAPDLVLSDVMMPRLDGFGLLRALRGEEALRDVPIILLSARAGEESRVAGVDAGADDYLTKPFSARELLARVGANLALARARREALETLRGLNATLEARVVERTRERDSMWRLSRELMVVARPDGTTLAVNPACIDTLGWAEDELLGPGFRDLVHPDDRTATTRENESLGAGRATPSFENRLRHRDGSYRWIVWTAVPQEGIVYAVGRDVTEARATEERLRQAQKMETIGQLTGGVAHDFNNLLTVVCGNLETIQRDAARLEGDGPSSRVRRAADNAMRGAQRAAVLTQRLLAFSRQQPLDPRTVNANRLVAGMSDLLSRTLGEHVEIETVLGGGLWLILADPNQLENALLNLAVNARDAMPGGGKLTIETANAHLNELYADDNAEVVAGQYVQIAVSDTGAGMPRGVMAQAFEPFFTTKDAGHGTGLGLSQVYGFVKQSGGHVKLYSEVGQGTTVKIYLPRLVTGKEEGEAEEERESPLPRGEPAEVVLVVEDDADVRLYSAELIRELGYRVLEAPTGPAGLELLEREAGVVSLLFTDVGLPGGMNGRQLADAARALRPGLPVLFTTGYARNAIVHGGRLDPGLQLINKPFTRAALAAKLREVLDAAVAPARVLLVEDDALIRMVAVEMLAEAGFQVEEAGNAGEALAKARTAGGRLAAAVVDFNLPDRPADGLAAELRAIRSDLPLVVASGYAEAELRPRFGDASRLAFVAKPYNASGLVEALRGLGVKVPGPRAAPS